MAPKGGKREKATLTYDREYYTPAGARQLEDKELRAEYSRLRSIARKRLERFAGTEWEDSQVYRLNAGEYKPLKEVKSNSELRHLLSDVARFVTAKTGSVSGLEKQRTGNVKALQEHGYKFVTKENYREFANFMEHTRAMTIAKILDSKRVAEFYARARKKGLRGMELATSFSAWSEKQLIRMEQKNTTPVNSKIYRKGK